MRFYEHSSCGVCVDLHRKSFLFDYSSNKVCVCVALLAIFVCTIIVDS